MSYVPLRGYGPEMYINKIKTFLAHLRNQLNAYKKLYILYSIWPLAFMVTTTNAYAVCRSTPVPLWQCGPEMYINIIKHFWPT